MVASKSFIPNFSSFGIGEIFAVLSVLATGWWSVGRKMISDKLNNKEVTIMTMMIAAISGFLIATLRGEVLNLAAFGMPIIWLGITIGAGLNLLLTFSENFAFKHIDVVIGNQILMISTVFAMINGAIFFRETVSVTELLGGSIILLSVYLANRKQVTEG